MSICTFWRHLFGRGPEDGAHQRVSEDSFRDAEYRNLQAHDLLREALESLIDTHVSEEPVRSGPAAAADPDGQARPAAPADPDNLKEDP